MLTKKACTNEVWIFFTPHPDVRQRWITRGTPTLPRSNRGFTLSSATICPTMSTSYIIETKTTKMALLVVLRAKGCLYHPLLFTLFDNLDVQMILKVLHYWKSVSFSLLDVQPAQIYVFHVIFVDGGSLSSGASLTVIVCQTIHATFITDPISLSVC